MFSRMFAEDDARERNSFDRFGIESEKLRYIRASLVSVFQDGFELVLIVMNELEGVTQAHEDHSETQNRFSSTICPFSPHDWLVQK